MALGVVVGVLLSCCREKTSAAPSAEVAKPEPTGGVEKKQTSEEANPERAIIYQTSSIEAPVLATILPDYEDLTGMKIIVSDSVTDADNLTVNSPLQMTRDDMITFYHQSFEEQGFEIRPVNDTTVYFARKAGTEREVALTQKPRRRVIGAPTQASRPVLEAVEPADEAEAGEEDPDAKFIAVSIQTSVIEVLAPEYGELVKKKIVTDSSIGAGFTMTINSLKKMSRAEAIEFYEDSFRINGYTLTPIDGQTVLLSKGE